jgi:DNA-binding response OmpR family regulator
LRAVRILLATDVDWLVDDVVAALGGAGTAVTVCTEGRRVSDQVAAVAAEGGAYDLVIADLQIGSMGGVAVTMALRLDASVGRVPAVPVLLLLDRVADVHLGKRCGADGWLVKPLDPLRLRRAARAVAAGGRYTEGLVDDSFDGAPARRGTPTIDSAPAVDEIPTEQVAGTEPAATG